MNRFCRDFFCFVILALYFFLNSGQTEYTAECIILIVSLLFSGAVFSYVDDKYKLDILEPYPFCCIFMFGIFLIMPIVDIQNGDVKAFGVNVMPWCIEGTLFFDFAFVLFTYGYFANSRQNSIKKMIVKNTTSVKYDSAISLYALILFFIFYTFSLYDQISRGFSINYIFSIGAQGSFLDNDISGAHLSFLGLFTNSLVTLWLIYITYGKSTVFKTVITFLLIIMLLVRTSRHIMIDMIVAPIAYYYIVRNKRPKVSMILLGLIALIFFSGIIGFLRGGIRTGSGISFDGMQQDDIWGNLKFNFQIYKSYYGVLHAIPNYLDYYYGKQLLYTFIMIIPRAIWPNKPFSYQAEIIGTGLNEDAVICGFAFPNLGEFYGDFGYIGGAICYLIFGHMLKHWKSYYCGSGTTKVSVIKYSILLPVCMQLIIRGAIYQNFYLVVFMLLPFWILNYIMQTVYKVSFK